MNHLPALPLEGNYLNYREALQVVSTEARAMYNVGRANLTFWTPNINIVRDPRWGRAMETSGEDPFLTSVYAVSFVRGMQEGAAPEEEPDVTPGRGPHRLKVSACCKHYIAYDLENWEGIDRHHFDAQVTIQDLEDSYNPPFQSCIQEGRASSLMCSYNRVNGIPSCASHEFLTNIVREQWHLDGYIVSDCGAVLRMYRDVSYASTPEDAVADALHAGMDVECGSYSASHGQEAYDQGKLNETTINSSLINQYLVRMRLGMFDGDPRNQRYGELGPSDVCTEANQELALEAARQGIVLLKNDGNSLPLKRSSNLTLAVVGPHSKSSTDLLGNYHGIPCKDITPLQGIEKLAGGSYGNVNYSPGCNETTCEGDDLIADAVSISREADAIIIFAGLNLIQEREKLDRTSLSLPGYQQKLIQAIADIANSKPVVLVIISGGPVDLSFAKDDGRIQSILWVGYPGEAGGQAIAEVIFGDYNPGGRTPVTWYPESYTLVNMTDMHMRPNDTTGYPGRTYRFHTQPVVYEFGHGMSYSTFEYRFLSSPVVLKLSPTDAPQNSTFQVTVVVKNNSSRGGYETVLLYSRPPEPGVEGAPLKQLVAFKKVHLIGNSETQVVFDLDPFKHLTVVEVDGKHVLRSGDHSLQVAEQTLRVTVSTD
ncbi:hypothetical protein KC19_11G048200 [Ceratodon purpureus]|uniref:Fibronectin type III-like domain-containing protein n=2 Tax=Ceratodon purpureus TaxID=3225 RepID=A0A8T0GE31_CERPU|nr:hypothetical protein KC19_11G048200 [Ceratodon purpureus]